MHQFLGGYTREISRNPQVFAVGANVANGHLAWKMPIKARASSDSCHPLPMRDSDNENLAVEVKPHQSIERPMPRCRRAE